MNNYNNYDEKDPLIGGDKSCLSEDGRINVVIEHSQNPTPRCLAAIQGLIAIVIVIATMSFCSLELYYLATIRNNTSCTSSYTISNSMLMLYLSLVIAAVLVHLIFIAEKGNWLDKTKFRNYPMLMILFLFGCIDITYYTMMLLKYVVIGDQLLSIFSMLTEYLFNGAILPFIIMCVCYKVSREHPRIKITIATTIFACIGGCLIVFVKRVTSKIIRVFNMSCDTGNSEYQLKIEDTEYILNRVDTTYLLMCMILLVYSSLNYRRPPVDSLTNHESNQSSMIVDFRAIITLVKYRWPTLTISTILVVLYLCCTNILFMVSGSNMPNKDNYQILFLSVNMVVYIACIAYTLVYYFTDNSSVSNLSREDAQTDVFFATFFALFQILHVVTLIGYYIWFYYGTTFPTTCIVKMTTFVLMIIQIAAQLWYIISAMKKTCPRTDVSKYNSRWFPPIALAVFNFGFLVHDIFYPGSGGFNVPKNSTQNLVYSIIKNVISPIALLNRLHGMVFFINLTWQKWNES